MTEIEKMFENAGINKLEIENCTYKNSTPCGYSCDDGEDCPYLEIKNDYPPFIAEKQLRLIEWFISSNRWWLNWLLNIASLDKKLDFSLDEKLAKLVNRLWESFDDQEKEEIRNILNA